MLARTRKLLSAGVVGAIAVSAFTVYARKPASGAAESAFAVVEAVRGELRVSVEATGVVEAVRTIEVKSRASGELRNLYVESGDAVTQGMLLAEVDPRDVRNAYEQAKADLQSARVSLQTAKAQLDRMAQLKASASVTEQEYENALQAYASAEAAVVRSQTNLDLAGEKLGDVTIRSPINGTVIERTVEPGQIIASATGNVSGGTTLFKVADLSQMRVRTLVDETDIARIQAGMTALVTADAYPDRPFRGTVEKIEPQAVVEQNVTMFPVLIRLDNPDGLLKPGMNAEVVVQVARRENVVMIENGAIVARREAANLATALGVDPSALSALGRGNIVFVQTAAGIEPRAVQLGISDFENTEVLSGLDAGDRVVLAAMASMKHQQQQQTDRMRARAGGVVPGAGGPPPPPRGGGG